MSLEPGRTLSQYRLVEKLGEGGMGVVWKALDTRLDREVAIKILPDEFASDRDRVAPFEREAKLLASLNHSNIAGIYGLEHVDGLHFLVMEFVPGESLAQRLERGPLSLDDALETCGQVALALEAAHDSGVVHRDLKPANVLVTPEGTVKVLDFGLAKSYEAGAISGDPSASPTLTAAGTAAGVILGTAAYMSPEQARGKPLDRRTDVWSFGCLLFECLTGESAFGGDTISDSLAAILKVEPDWSRIPPGTPPRVRDLLERCLAKDKRQRQRDIGDARLELERAREAGPDADALLRTDAGRSGRRAVNPMLVPAALLVGLLVGIGLWSALSGRGEEGTTSAPTRLSFVLPEGRLAGGAYLSPDGSLFVYGASSERPQTPEEGSLKLYLRRLDEFESRMVESSYGLNGATFSPDGRWLAFVATGSAESSTRRIFKVPLDGSTPPLAIARVSRDGKWFAYASASSGRRELYLRQVGADGSLGLESPVTTNGAAGFTWLPGHSGERSRLLYLTPDQRVFTVLIDGNGISSPQREPWFETVIRDPVGLEPLPDGRALAILKGEEEVPLREYRVVLNWTEEFKRKVGAAAP